MTYSRLASTICIFVLLSSVYGSFGLLFPQKNEYRRADVLDGLWTFVAEPPNSDGIGLINHWADLDLSKFENATVMPVPSAYNDITTEKSLRDHVGWIWYQTVHYLHHESLPKCSPQVSASQKKVCRARAFSTLYFESVNYAALVFLNGHKVVSHYGGHLPFEAPISSTVLDSQQPSKLVVTVAVNNSLSSSTIPPGEFHVYNIPDDPDGRTFVEQTPGFDFFHYAGILRSVHVVHVPTSRITQVYLNASVQENGTGVLKYDLADRLDEEFVSPVKTLFDVEIYSQQSEKLIQHIRTFQHSGEIRVKNVEMWWPRGYGAPNLYRVEIKYTVILNEKSRVLDIYRDTIGFRTVSIDENSIFINFKKFYCIGFGMHEESEIRGRGFDRVIMTKDLNMVEWMSANCYRTSHYPYSEERAREADRRGIAVITEAPAVGMASFTEANRLLHTKILTEMIERDRNRPSVIMWSVANEPKSAKSEAAAYFKTLADHVRALDSSRPVTAVLNVGYGEDRAAEYMDVIGVNRYVGWYSDLGHSVVINATLCKIFKDWHAKHHKPVFIAEYGAEAIAGLSEDPARPFSEQYQIEVLHKTHQAFDHLRNEGFLTGEMIWNFADFMTDKSLTRVAGNHKGVLTRDRKPKASAYFLRRRYSKILDALPKIHDEL